MEESYINRLINEANSLIKQSSLPRREKTNLRRNIKYFMSYLSDEKYVAGCTWEWFDFGEDGNGLNLKWDWKNVSGEFGFYTDNGHGFSFTFGENGEAVWTGGHDGEYGFTCGMFIHDLESQLKWISQQPIQQ